MARRTWGPDRVQELIRGAVAANARPESETVHVRRAGINSTEACLGAIVNQTEDTWPAFAPPVTKLLLVPEVLERLLPLVSFPEAESLLVSLQASQTIDHVARNKDALHLLKDAGAVKILMEQLDVLSRKERVPQGYRERCCKALLGAVRSLAREPQAMEELERTGLCVILVELLRTGSDVEKALAAACLAHVCSGTRPYMAHTACARGVVPCLLPMLRTTESELTRLCACAAINQLSTVEQARPFLAKDPSIVHLLLDIFELEDSPHKTHEQTRFAALCALNYLLQFKDLRPLMADEKLVDLALDILDVHSPEFNEQVQLFTLIFGLHEFHSEEEVGDVVETFLRACQSDSGLVLSHAGCLFMGYVVTRAPDRCDVLRSIWELDGVEAVARVAGDHKLPLLIRENAMQVLLLVSEDYDSLTKFFAAGALEVCCVYLLPSTNRSELTSIIATLLLQALCIHNRKRVMDFLHEKYKFARKVLMEHPEAEARSFLVKVKVNRRLSIIREETKLVDMSTLTPEELEEIRQTFLKFDLDMSATIDVDELREVFASLGINLNFLQLRAIIRATGDSSTDAIGFSDFVRVLVDYKHGKITGLGYVKDLLKESVQKVKTGMLKVNVAEVGKAVLNRAVDLLVSDDI